MNEELQKKLELECQSWRVNVNTLEDLIAQGVNLNYANENGSTSVHSMVVKNFKALNLLIEHGANIFIKNNQGATALHIAAQYLDTQSSIILLINKGLDINEKDNHQMTPLHCAVMIDNVETVQLLIKLGADLTLTEESGQNAYELAQSFQRNRVEKYLQMYLLEKEKANLEKLIKKVNQNTKIKL